MTPFLRKHRNRLEEREKRLEAVVMDMAGHFRTAVNNVFPDTEVVGDRFHLERKAYGALHNVRRREAARADESDQEPAPTDGFRTEWKRRKEKLEKNWHNDPGRENESQGEVSAPPRHRIRGSGQEAPR
ncbi:transposase [Salinibacter ruber]|uniref:transposase n=1 Tax=Salinibacter ruber TaxID=146919 RepID=UPI003C6DFCD9